MNEIGHVPVLVKEVAANLAVNKKGAYLDLTAGLGGHLKELSRILSEEARLYGVDRDPEAVELAREKLKDSPQFKKIVCASYDTLDELFEEFEDKEFDGILLDLGISSLQIDDARRGFSYQSDGPLDMRFDQTGETTTAADIVNTRSEKELADIFFNFGEEKRARRLAGIIVRERQKEMILTTTQLTAIIKGSTPQLYHNKTLSRVYQSLRIAVNDELERLNRVLPQIVRLLKPAGRIAVLTYHSLEDRIIKRFFRQMVKGCTCPDRFDVCMCENLPTLKIVNKKPILPTEEEIAANSRARSAKLRIAEKI